ncbi:MAG: alginate export family protein [Myxococcota bacterium]
MLLIWAAMLAGSPCEHGFHHLRYDDDDSCRPLALEVDEQNWLRLGGEVRQRLTFVENFEFGDAFEAGDWIGSQRYFLNLDGRWAGRLQTFVQLGSLVAINQGSPPSPTERNDFDLLQAFVRWKGASIRPWAGRRVLQLGSQRLVARREGPNVRRNFDGLGLELEEGLLTLSALLARPVLPQQSGVFNDFQRPEQMVWGSYATLEDHSIGLDLYYLGSSDEEARFDGGVLGRELRHSFGLRAFGARYGADWDIEAILQVGDFEGREILAWTLASMLGYRFQDLPLSPRLGLSVNVASGERNPGDGRVDAFNALFPRGNYFSEAAVLGPRNFYNVHGFLSIEPLDGLDFTTDLNGYWRFSLEDGVYGPPGNLIRGPADSEARFVVLAWSNAFQWTINRWVDATAIYTVQDPGRFIEETGEAPLTHFAEFTVRLRF